MSIYIRDPRTGNIRTMTNREIKSQIIELLETQRQVEITNADYKRLYDVYALKVANYNTLLQPETPVKANEALLRKLRREAEGKPLTAELENIEAVTAQSRTKFRRRIQADDLSQREIDLSIQLVENRFKEMLQVPSIGQAYKKFVTEDRLQYIDEETGEIIDAVEASARGFKNVIVNRVEARKILRAADILEFLKNEAIKLHNRKKRLARATGQSIRDVGSS